MPELSWRSRLERTLADAIIDRLIGTQFIADDLALVVIRRD